MTISDHFNITVSLWQRYHPFWRPHLIDLVALVAKFETTSSAYYFFKVLLNPLLLAIDIPAEFVKLATRCQALMQLPLCLQLFDQSFGLNLLFVLNLFRLSLIFTFCAFLLSKLLRIDFLLVLFRIDDCESKTVLPLLAFLHLALRSFGLGLLNLFLQLLLLFHFLLRVLVFPDGDILWLQGHFDLKVFH